MKKKQKIEKVLLNSFINKRLSTRELKQIKGGSKGHDIVQEDPTFDSEGYSTGLYSTKGKRPPR